MKYFDHIYIPEQVIPALGIQTSGIIQELFKVQAETPEYALGKVLDTLKTDYIENETKQQQVRQLIEMFIQKYDEKQVDLQKLKEALLLFYLVKSVRDFVHTPPKGSPNSPEQMVSEFLDFLSYRNAAQQMSGLRLKKITFIPEDSNIRPTITNHSGTLEKVLEQYFSKLDKTYMKLLSTFSSLGLTEAKIEDSILKLLHFDLDYLLHDMVYSDFFSFVTKDSATYEGRLLNMFNIFVITHDLRPGESHPDFKKYNTADLQTLKEYRNYRLREVRRILDKKHK